MHTILSRVFAALCLSWLAFIAEPTSHASADPFPPGFPNLDPLTQVPAELYLLRFRGAGSIRFSTPDGIDCEFPYSPSGSGKTSSAVRCSGSIPGIPDGAPHVGGQSECSYGRVVPDPYRLDTSAKGCDWPAASNKLLDVGQRIESGPVTCGVGEDYTACIDHDHHGFVLRESGSWTF